MPEGEKIVGASSKGWAESVPPCTGGIGVTDLPNIGGGGSGPLSLSSSGIPALNVESGGGNLFWCLSFHCTMVERGIEKLQLPSNDGIVLHYKETTVPMPGA